MSGIVVKTITHKHMHMFLIGANDRYILFDCGWQDSFPFIKASLKEFGVTFENIEAVFVSHFHPDHAGTVELLRQHGVNPMILEKQTPYIDWLNDYFKQQKNDPAGKFIPLDKEHITPISVGEANDFLKSVGIDGEIIYTPGHTPDSISLVVGDFAFVGDLQPFEDECNTETAESMKKVKATGTKIIAYAHAPLKRA